MLTTLNTIKAELGLTGSDLDDALTRYIKSAGNRIEAYCRRSFGLRAAVVDTFRDVRGLGVLVLSDPHVRSVTSVVVDGEALAAELYEEHAGLLYRLTSDGGRCLWSGTTITVTFSAGYIAPGEEGADLPAAVEQACIDLVRDQYNSRDRDAYEKSVSYGDGMSVSYGTIGVAAEVFGPRSLLSGYRNWTPA